MAAGPGNDGVDNGVATVDHLVRQVSVKVVGLVLQVIRPHIAELFGLGMPHVGPEVLAAFGVSGVIHIHFIAVIGGDHNVVFRARRRRTDIAMVVGLGINRGHGGRTVHNGLTRQILRLRRQNREARQNHHRQQQHTHQFFHKLSSSCSSYILY